MSEWYIIKLSQALTFESSFNREIENLVCVTEKIM